MRARNSILTRMTGAHIVLRTSLRWILCLSAAMLLSGCLNLPLHKDGINDPALQEINQAFVDTVEQAHNNPQQQWTSGWLGNMWINFHGDNNRGLCFEWKYLVHDGVKATVARVGWQSTGIVINRGAAHEHHAVVVYNPDITSRGRLLTADINQSVYVLDAWRQGQADIYTMQDWLALAGKVAVAPRIIPLEKPVQN